MKLKSVQGMPPQSDLQALSAVRVEIPSKGCVPDGAITLVSTAEQRTHRNIATLSARRTRPGLIQMGKSSKGKLVVF